MEVKNSPLATLSKERYFNGTYFVLLCLPAVGREEVVTVVFIREWPEVDS
jgi:hypothetical protein